jgi:hypothetical protein
MKARDLWGGLKLPMAVPQVGEAQNRTRGIGDPALAVVGSFVATVLRAEVGEAAGALWPGMPELAVDADMGAGSPPVRRIYLFQPGQERPFVKEDLPAIFVFRYGGEKSKFEQFTSDTSRSDVPIMVWWVQARTDPEREKYLDPFINAVGKAVMGAISFGYHRAWVLDSDRNKPGALVTIPGQTAAQVVSGTGINGALAGYTMAPSRSVYVQTRPVVGAYTPGAVITVNGIDGRGLPWSDTVTLTNPDGGENLLTAFRFQRLTSFSVPPMATNNGIIVCGYGPNPELASGSRFMRAAGISSFLQRHAGEVRSLPFKTGDPPDTVMLRAFEMSFECLEDFDPDPSLHSADPVGMDGTYALPNGNIFVAHDTF